MLKVTYCWIRIVTSSYCPCWDWVWVRTKPRQPESGVTGVILDWSCHGPLFTGFVPVTQWDSESLLELVHYGNAGSPLAHLEQNHLGIFPSPNTVLWRVLFETSLPALPSTDCEPWISLGSKQNHPAELHDMTALVSAEFPLGTCPQHRTRYWKLSFATWRRWWEDKVIFRGVLHLGPGHSQERSLKILSLHWWRTMTPIILVSPVTMMLAVSKSR